LLFQPGNFLPLLLQNLLVIGGRIAPATSQGIKNYLLPISINQLVSRVAGGAEFMQFLLDRDLARNQTPLPGRDSSPSPITVTAIRR
jgi:hypothetical protein